MGYFDVREQLFPPRGGRGIPPSPAGDAPLSISAVTKLVDRAIKSGVPATVAVRGEVTNWRGDRGSGHAYFDLKDPDAVLHCVMFRDSFERVKFAPGNGMELVAVGNVRVYPTQGRHQLYVDQLSPVGAGALDLAVRQLREKLGREGLFGPERKRPVPRYPQRIVIVTSRSTAAFQDMLKVIRRFPWVRVLLCHVPVQGEGCGAGLARAVAGVNQHVDKLGGADLILLGRGGGSTEDLFGFNDEGLARAIYASRLPVVTGIGHEVDVSIADLVADHHAHTPTEAATVATAGWRTAGDDLRAAAARLGRGLDGAVRDASHRLERVERHEVFARPTDRIDDLRQRIDDRGRSLQIALAELMRRRATRLQMASDRLARQTPAARAARAAERLAAADRRLATAVRFDLRRRVAQLQVASDRLARQAPAAQATRAADRLAAAGRRLTTAAGFELRRTAGTIDVLADRLTRSLTSDLRRRADRVASLSSQLEALSPQRTLERGYTVTRRAEGGVVRSATELATGERIVTRFADGEVGSTVSP